MDWACGCGAGAGVVVPPPPPPPQETRIMSREQASPDVIRRIDISSEKAVGGVLVVLLPAVHS
jgi:hypothetical protein